MYRRLLRTCVTAVAVLAMGAAAYSQHTTASVSGTITDASGGVISGADVTLMNVETSVVAHTTTNGSGYFSFQFVTPGQYTMTVTKPDFKKVVLPVFYLVVNQRLTENETLNVGAENETRPIRAGAIASPCFRKLWCRRRRS